MVKSERPTVPWSAIILAEMDGYRVANIARLAGLDHAQLRRYLRTGAGLSAESLERVATVLGLSLGTMPDRPLISEVDFRPTVEGPALPTMLPTPSPAPVQRPRLNPHTAAKLGR